MQPEIAISLRGIRNSFSGHVVHNKLDLDVRRGEVLGLIGGSGAGKSVLLRTIIGIREPDAGEITVMGINLTKGSDKDWQQARTSWGVLFQNGALFSSLTVAENIKVPLNKFTRMSSQLKDEVAALKIELAGLKPDAAHKYPSELSGGMRKRAGLARALAMDPAILLLDEPTAGLDPIGAAEFDLLIKTLTRSLGLTVFLVTHDIDTLYTICDRVAVLAEQRIYTIGTIDELKNDSLPWLQSYFNGPRGRAAEGTAHINKLSQSAE